MKILFLIPALALAVMSANAQEEIGVTIGDITWATRNVDAPNTFAATPQDPGMFYQWNSNAGWTIDGVPSDGTSVWNEFWDGGGADTWKTANNVCPAGWRIPTMEELENLLSSERVYQTTPISGVTFGSGSNTIFLPEYGFLLEDGTSGANESIYWGNSCASGNVGTLIVQPHYSEVLLWSTPSARGGCVRCVKESTVGVNSISSDTEKATVTAYFDMLGRELKKEPATGLYIIRYDNGTARKVVK